MKSFPKSSRLSLLTDSEIGYLADKAAAFLSERGVQVHHDGMLAKLKGMGAGIDAASGSVRFPRELQEQALQSVPRTFSLSAPGHGGDSGPVLPIPHPDGSFYVCTGTGARGYLDPETGEHRPLTIEDAKTWGRLVGALENIDICAFPTPTDARPETVDVHALDAVLRSTTKHVWIQPHTEQSLPFLFELCVARAGGRENLKRFPLASIIACSLTPFRFKPMDIEVIMQACNLGLPVHASSLPVLGGTSPITSLATVLTAAIEVLSMVIMIQLIKPGNPVFALATALGMDMMSGRAVKACPEAMQANAAGAQFLTEAYGLPVHTAGLTSDTFEPDGQAMVEHSLFCHMVVAAGAAVIGRAGELEAAKTFSPVQLVVDDEIVAALRRLRALQVGPALEEDSIAWKDILTVAPGGHFLETGHTLRHCREVFRPELFVRQSRESWESGGRRTLIDRARDRCRELCAAFCAPEIPQDRLQEMERVVAEADRALAK